MKKIKEDNSSPKGRLKGFWRTSYTFVLIANAVYILVFWLIMKIFN